MLGDALKDVLNEKDMTIQELADISGVPMETVRNIYYDKVQDVKGSTLLKLSKSLDVSMNLLMGEPFFKREEYKLLREYQKCGTHGKSIIQLIAKYESSLTQSERENVIKHKIPCVVPVGRVTDGIRGNGNDVIEVYTTLPKAYLAFEITNNNFSPAFCKGDRILLENRFPEDGERGVFSVGEKVYFRQYIEMGRTINLKCVNRIGKDIIINRADEVGCIGTYVGVINV